MKISIVIPSNNEAKYVEDLIDFIKKNSNSNNIEEIIIVESFNTRKIIKVAEKSHAKLYFNQLNDKIIQMEMGAFQANAEVIYFIKPGCVPPIGFDDRILTYVRKKYEMGCFDFECLDADNYFKFMIKTIKAFFLKDFKSPDSFYVLSSLYFQTVGFKASVNYLQFKKQVLALGKQVHN
jgi:glycosyltransferase involved in cell wall biosynthesis